MINKDHTIGEILELNPNAAQILEQACYVHGLKLEEVMAKLNEK